MRCFSLACQSMRMMSCRDSNGLYSTKVVLLAVGVSGDDAAGERLAAHRIAQHAIVGSADEPVGATEADREITIEFGRRRQRSQCGIGEPVDGAVLLPAEE